MKLDTLPSEILLQILSYLLPPDLIPTQSLSRRFHTLGRDPAIWKEQCFLESHAERRRLHHLRLDASPRSSGSRYAPLLRAMMELVEQGEEPVSTTSAEGERTGRKREGEERRRIAANWDPGFPGEKIDYYEEYMQRRANVSVDWFEGCDGGREEVTGVGVVYGRDGEVAEKIVGALADGSVAIWQADVGGKRGTVIARSKVGLLTVWQGRDEDFDFGRTKTMMTETGAVECVSVDSVSEKAYFGVLNELVEVDLTTLRVLSREAYPFPITALSEARNPTPITVGTNLTLHIYDPRNSHRKQATSSRETSIQLIGGGAPTDFSRIDNGNTLYSHATLAEPGPLSILHLPDNHGGNGNGSIWVAGRFTSLLNYDRRFFPRLRGHLHSGARLSCLRSIPHPYVPRELSLMSSSAMSISAVAEAKSRPGMTLIAGGEYKGKGSLEMYGLSPDSALDPAGARTRNTSFLNRQTASGSKVLSVAEHGGKLVYADSDGFVRWVERDGFSPVRTWDLNGGDVASQISHPHISIFGAPGETREPPEDIVQLLLPTRPKATTVSSGVFGEDNLVVWTGEGKVGLLGFGRPKWKAESGEEEALRFVEREERREERDYDVEMGYALRAHANELNFLRGLGRGF